MCHSCQFIGVSIKHLSGCIFCDYGKLSMVGPHSLSVALSLALSPFLSLYICVYEVLFLMEVYNSNRNIAFKKWKEICALLQIIVIDMHACLFERIFFFLRHPQLFQTQHAVHQFYQILCVMCSHKPLKAQIFNVQELFYILGFLSTVLTIQTVSV